MTSNIDYELLNEQIEKTMKRRKSVAQWVFFGVNVLMFVIFTLLMWGMALGSPTLSQMMQGDDSPIIGILMLATMGWLTGVIFHGISTLMASGLMDNQIRKDVASREFGSLILDQAMQSRQEKAKRELDTNDEEEVMISDDGELVPVKRQQSR
jgi:hypothetical protein